MNDSLFSILKAFLLGEGKTPPASLLLNRHGGVINRELAALFTTILVDMSLSDNALQESEVHEIVSILRNELALSEDSAEQVFTTTLEARKNSEEIIPKLSLIGASLNDDQKEHLLVLALHVARADERITKEEDSILSMLCKQLNLTTEQVQRIWGRR